MDEQKHASHATQVGLVLSLALAGMLTGCVGFEEEPDAGYYTPYTPPAAVAVQDDYIYYPNYECYYSVSQHQYTYRVDNDWVSRPAPRDVSVNVLLASPSVKMDFHDSPAPHHAAVVKQYPKNRTPSLAKSGQGQQEAERQGNHEK